MTRLTLPHSSPRDTDPGPTPRGLLPPDLVREMLACQVLLQEEWERLPADAADEVSRSPDGPTLLAVLVRHGLLTEFQAGQITQGGARALIVGGYRLCGRIGSGGMGVVYLAEHIALRRRVALKVARFGAGDEPASLQRFQIEMRTAAQINHPGVVTVYDAGQVRDAVPEAGVLHYMAMEHLEGRTLQDVVAADGPLDPAAACGLIAQVAAALAEAHRQHLVHRDIKPSNVFVTSDGRAKLLDFGVARNFRSRMTETGAVLGTVDYMAPEQTRDAAAVDIRADIFSLGATLFWCLTGRPPFDPSDDILQALAQRAKEPPPSPRAARPAVPRELDALVRRMMALDPAERPADPSAVLQALHPFCRAASAETPPEAEGGVPGIPGRHRALIVDDEPENVELCARVLEAEGIVCRGAAGGDEALEDLRRSPCDVVILDMQLPGMSGDEVMRRLRQEPPSPHLKIILTSGMMDPDVMARLLQEGADDFLPKPFSLTQLRARVKAALRHKDAQDQAGRLRHYLQKANDALERDLLARDGDLVMARNVLVLAMAKLVECREYESGRHLVRMQQYCRILAEEAAAMPSFKDQIDPQVVETLECCVPLHDIGKVGVPDHILLKPAPLTPEERVIMQAHTTIGAETLREVARQHPYSPAFMRMAIDIARHHHERWDGTGYPDRLAGADTPLAARLTALADVYDALRSRRIYKPALTHAAAVHTMTETRGQFDPALLAAFRRCAPRLEEVFERSPG